MCSHGGAHRVDRKIYNTCQRSHPRAATHMKDNRRAARGGRSLSRRELSQKDCTKYATLARLPGCEAQYRCMAAVQQKMVRLVKTDE